MENLIKKYLDAGVFLDKIVVSKLPSACKWSLSRKCLVGENGIEPFELVDDGNGNKRLSFDNNRLVFMLQRTELTELDVNEINNSNGIIISDATYGKPYFRFGFIPTE